MEPVTISVADAARVLGIGMTNTWAQIRSGKLQTLKLGRRTLVKTSSIRALVGEAA